MAKIDALKRIVQDSTELSKAGEPRQALKLLDESIEEAIREQRPGWVRVLSRHASVIADSVGDLQRARYYCEQVLSHAPESPGALYALADVLFREGETEKARTYAIKCYRVSVIGSGEENKALVELLRERWPDSNRGDEPVTPA